MSLYQKYQPTTLEGMIGSYTHVETMLQNKHVNRFHLYTGNPGCGKGTLAKIVTKLLGANMNDVVELNCSDSTGVDDMRRLIDKSTAIPFGKTWVMLLDECHKLTTAAQETLNKPLEDIRSNCFWIMMTSKPEKLLDSILTRATKIHLPDIGEDNLYQLVKRVANEEQYNVTQNVCALIAEKAKGSARNALSILEVVAALDSNEHSAYLADYDETPTELIDLCRAVYKKNWHDAITRLTILQTKYDTETIRRTVLGYFVNILSKDYSVNLTRRTEYLLDTTYEFGYNHLVVLLAKCCRSDA